jgi:hypothetical protein
VKFSVSDLNSISEFCTYIGMSVNENKNNYCIYKWQFMEVKSLKVQIQYCEEFISINCSVNKLFAN